jgi:GT2 family glycosyltransferase
MADGVSISVVVPTRNKRERTLKCLASLWLCDPQANEVVVVDDGSSDDTVHSVVRKYPRHIVVRLPQSVGFSGAAGHGIARSSGDVVVLIHPNVEVARGSLGAVAEAFTKDRSLGLAGAVVHQAQGPPRCNGGRMPSAVRCFLEATGLPSMVGRLRVLQWFQSLSRTSGGPVDWVSASAMAVRRSVWLSHGPFDPSCDRLGHDLDLCVETARGGWRIEVIERFRVVVQNGSGSGPGDRDRWPDPAEAAWPDLLRLADRRFGSSRAARTARALQMGHSIRRLGRHLAGPLLPREDGEASERSSVTSAPPKHGTEIARSERRARPR